MPRGRPHASWLRQVESYLKDAGMAGLASDWAMAKRRTKEYRRKVDAATRCCGVCPYLTLFIIIRMLAAAVPRCWYIPINIT